MESRLPKNTDVFIVGGGPAGLAAAIAARARGFDVALADRQRPPVDKVCGEGMMPDGLAAARALGLDFSSAGQPFRGIRFIEGNRSVAADFPAGQGLGVRRTVLHEIMATHAARIGVRMAYGTNVTGLGPQGVVTTQGLVRARWIVGADGGNSLVRSWAGLDAHWRNRRRFGFRRHYRLEPWSEHMEIHWGRGCQFYITPTGPREVCVVLISTNPRLRLEDALPQFPELARRLAAAESRTAERGCISASLQLKTVYRTPVLLLGDASGSVDAITGEGLSLSFRQALAAAQAMESGDLERYQQEHWRIRRRPAFMAELMLLLDLSLFRKRAMRALAARPPLFSRMLAMHVHGFRAAEVITTAVAFGWEMFAP
jgi:flavin-dependent dehydrogenase